MKIIRGIYTLSEPLASSVVTIGNFDGVHLGHRAILKHVVENSERLGTTSVLMTFCPHPRQVLRPDLPFLRLFSIADQESVLSDLGIQLMIQEPFSRDLSDLSPDRFFHEWILRPLNPQKIIVGYDFTFGKNREGNLERLQLLCEQAGVEFEIVPAKKVDSVIISSSKIKQVLEDGDVPLATRLLGRNYYVEGIVEKGDGRGHRIGIPTANIYVEGLTIPKRGVYITRSWIKGIQVPSVTNIGVNPTFKSEGPPCVSVETHLLDFQDDIYGLNLRVEFLKNLREEKKFSSVEDLVKQIRLDIIEAREFHRSRQSEDVGQNSGTK